MAENDVWRDFSLVRIIQAKDYWILRSLALTSEIPRAVKVEHIDKDGKVVRRYNNLTMRAGWLSNMDLGECVATAQESGIYRQEKIASYYHDLKKVKPGPRTIFDFDNGL